MNLYTTIAIAIRTSKHCIAVECVTVMLHKVCCFTVYTFFALQRDPRLFAINPANAGGEIVVEKLELQRKQRYTSVDDLKEELFHKFIVHTEGYETQFGYIIPGHGKKETIDTNEGLETMYTVHQSKKRIWFWLKCIPRPAKKRPSDSSNAPLSKRQSDLMTTMNEVSETFTKLKDQHGEKYTDLQLNCWAHMINTKKYTSFDIAPNKRFFGKKKNESVGVSPGGKISLRTECINQQDKWHQLREWGVTTCDEYDQKKAEILLDINKF